MQRVALASTMITSAAYDEAEQVLELSFTNGSAYRYRLVPRRVFDDLVAADSAGAFFLEMIKSKFPFHKIS